MTSDAKVGLLLGLVFIVIIAFLINGLPNLLNKDNSEEIVSNSVTEQVNNWGPKDQAESVVRSFSGPAVTNAASSTVQQPRATQTQAATSQPVVRQPIALRQTEDTSTTTTIGQQRQTYPIRTYPVRTIPVHANNVTAEPQSETIERQAPVITAQDLLPPSSSHTTESTPVERTVVKQIPAMQKPTVTTTPSKVYTVVSGDNLTKIAIKCYGKVEGNKLSNINNIFNANKKTLKSPDSIYVGQQLSIPAISNKPFGIATEQPRSSERQTVSPAVSSSGDVYVVRENDSLWTIAVDKLGNGNRYLEIMKLNKDQLPDEDYLTVGMKLKLPRR